MSRGLSWQQVGILLAMRQREQKYERGKSCVGCYYFLGGTLDCGSSLADIVQILYPEAWPTAWTWGRNRSLWRAVQSLRRRGFVHRLEGWCRRWRCTGRVYVTQWHNHALDRELVSGQSFRALTGGKVSVETSCINT